LNRCAGNYRPEKRTRENTEKGWVETRDLGTGREGAQPTRRNKGRQMVTGIVAGGLRMDFKLRSQGDKKQRGLIPACYLFGSQSRETVRRFNKTCTGWSTTVLTNYKVGSKEKGGPHKEEREPGELATGKKSWKDHYHANEKSSSQPGVLTKNSWYHTGIIKEHCGRRHELYFI